MKTKANPKLYLARAGRNGEDETYAIDNGLAIIRFLDYPSLASAKNYDDILKLVRKTKPELGKRAAGNYAGQLWAFVVAMEAGDLIVMPQKLTSQLALGRVTGPYKFQKIDGIMRHTRPVEWVRSDVARSVFMQDLLYSFGAFMTVCTITRNNAIKRVLAVMDGRDDPGFITESGKKAKPTDSTEKTPEDDDALINLAEAAHDQIVAQIQSNFTGHELSRLVDAVLNAEGWVTKLSPPGPDGGVDILAGRGSFGLDGPHLCVQVKSQTSPVDVTVYRTLQGSMQTFSAEQGLLVAWGGFNRAVLAEAKQGHFAVRLWESRDLVQAIYRNYENLPAEIQADLPLKRVWMLVQEEPES